MVPDDKYLRANAKDVAAKVVDGEAILINLSNGLYYSTDKAGAYVWSLLAGGSAVGAVVRAVSERYGVPVEQAAPDVRGFVADLLGEGLLEPGDGASDPVAAESTAAGPYEPPKLAKYEDMADMFALDPPLPELPAVPKSGPS